MHKRPEDMAKQTKCPNESSANLTESKFEFTFDNFYNCPIILRLFYIFRSSQRLFSRLFSQI
jgi:hypothetical protein